MESLATSTPPTEPVILVLSKDMLNAEGLKIVLGRLRILSATREDTWRYRQMVTLTVDGYNDDPRELVDIPEVRTYLDKLIAQWPFWGFFITPHDDSFKILLSCAAGGAFLGEGKVELDGPKLVELIKMAFMGMNELFERHSFPEPDLEAQSMEFIACLDRSGFPV